MMPFNLFKARQTSKKPRLGILRDCSSLSRLGFLGLSVSLISVSLTSAIGLSASLCSPGLAQAPPTFEASNAKGSMLYMKAVQAFNARDYSTCIQILKQASTLEAFNKNVFHLLALAYCENNDSYNAKMQFKGALQLDPNFVECRNNYGVMLKKTGDLEEAQRQFKECIRTNANYPNAHYNLGALYMQRGDLDAAVTELKTAVRLKPTYFEAQRDLGLAIYQKFERGDGGDIAECLDKLTTAARLLPANAMIHYHLANIHCADGNLDEAEAEFRQALSRDGNLAAAHFELARLRYLRGDPNRALHEVKLAQKASPMYNESKNYPVLDRIKVKQLQAKCEELLDDYQAAAETTKEVASLQANNKETLKKVTELNRLARSGGKRRKGEADPEEIKSLILTGIAESESGQSENAAASYSKACELDPNSFLAFQGWGAILEAQGDLRGAAEKYQAALDLRPKYDGLYYNMAYLLEKLNMRSEAGRWYKRFHEMAGKYPYDPKHIVSLQQDEARERMRQSGR